MSTVLALFHPLLSEAPSPRPLLIYLSTPRWPHLVAQPCRSSTSLHGRIGCLLIRGTPTSLWTPEQRLEEGAKWKRKCWETRIWTRCHARYQTRIFQWLPTETLLSTLDSFFLYSFWSIRQAERAHRSMFKRPFSSQKKDQLSWNIFLHKIGWFCQISASVALIFLWTRQIQMLNCGDLHSYNMTHLHCNKPRHTAPQFPWRSSISSKFTRSPFIPPPGQGSN